MRPEGGPTRSSRCRQRALFVGVSRDQAGVHGETFTAHQPFVQAALHHRLEQVTEQIAITEAAVPVLGKGGVVRHLSLQPEAAEPAVSQVQLDFLTQASLRADAEAIADQQHADHQLGVDGGPSYGAVEASQVLAQLGAVDEAINAP